MGAALMVEGAEAREETERDVPPDSCIFFPDPLTHLFFSPVLAKSKGKISRLTSSKQHFGDQPVKIFRPVIYTGFELKTGFPNGRLVCQAVDSKKSSTIFSFKQVQLKVAIRFRIHVLFLQFGNSSWRASAR
jgi:hypothetical protein